MSGLDDAYRRTLSGFGEVEVDDPEALERAEAAVRGAAPDAPRVRAASGEQPLPHWRALLRWPTSEEVRHRSMALLGLGANLGERERTIAEALRRVGEVPETTVAVVSHLYESEPWGDASQPPFANAVAAVATALRADQLLDECLRIEAELGRVRDGTRWGPRTIDIDILLFDDEEWASPRLTIPHPRLREREFVVVPLLEVAPEATLPDGSAVSREGASYGRITRVIGFVPGFERLTPPVPWRGERVEYVPEEGLAADERQAGDAEVELPRTEGWVVVETFQRLAGDGPVGALIHKTLLESAGVPVIMEPPGNVVPIVQTVRLLVPKEHEADARRLLVEAQAAGRVLESLGDE
ncbi:2-amino-4-hydroxy-6-hydroxymethyldihydropteridine diphosphokinase [Coriobacteriia bacterium Es71-Z0120]|uniref:2-amino-4-hydroxy-6- hydroxymethyldihydropteridine diphosphokinase n=1 Tax=Parvivirga hydrogeniphila TaxID=2939460 RepID=UPI002260C7DE|nr:2-amino-4-hydroxy-6-hydroxymethyldihydropteridine diphosphokinase [Parvivirga hydrogeniphila]MCL4079409.1 2-amino-4-hydroxy-6-hydroxymethyldihydropteridine diphosphokinase [Parvivirga hydrogeniphila]